MTPRDGLTPAGFLALACSLFIAAMASLIYFYARFP